MKSPGQPPVESSDPVSPRTIFRLSAAGALGVLLVALGALTLFTLRDLLVQVFIAVFIAVSLDPVIRWMIARRVSRGQAVAIVWLLFLIVTGSLLWAFLTPLISQANDLMSDFPGYLDRVRENSPTLRSVEDGLGLRPRVDRLAQDLPGRLAGEAVSVGQRFLGALVSVLLVVVLTIYLMLDLSRLRRGLVRLFPRRHRQQVSDIVNMTIEKVGSYMIGNLLISLIAGVTALIAFTALRVPFALPLAVLVAVTDLIPLIGATLGALISVIVAAATTDLWPNTVLLAIFFVVYQQVENYLIAPRVLRNSVDISALAVLFTALVGASVLGIVGALVAIPIAAVIKVVATERIRARDEAEAAASEDSEEPPPGTPREARTATT